MKVLITGAKGMVARAAIKYSGAVGDEVIALTRGQLDIADKERVAKIISDQRPDAVLNCAAYTDVDGAEDDREACFAANAAGVENLALACREINARFVTISTDYVFDGLNDGFYTQRDTPNPQGVYARSKFEGEIRARFAYARSIIVRSGWIYGTDGKNFLSVIPQLLSEGRPIKAIADSYGTPTFADDLARRLHELAELDLPCIFHAANSGPGTSYAGFAEKVCEIGGFDKSLVESVSKKSLQRPAPRPASSKLECLISEKLGLEKMPDWKKSLEKFLCT